jgi:hypothetical protein
METGEVIALVFFTMIVAGAIVSIVNIRSRPRRDPEIAATVERIEAKLDGRLDKIERRMANLETIVLEQEKHREFDRAL